MRAAQMTFHEFYGDLPAGLLRKVKRHNVSPSDYQSLVDAYGDDYSQIQDAIVRYSGWSETSTSFSEYKWRQGEAR